MRTILLRIQKISCKAVILKYKIRFNLYLEYKKHNIENIFVGFNILLNVTWPTCRSDKISVTATSN
jgi:hypothetical protein